MKIKHTDEAEHRDENIRERLASAAPIELHCISQYSEDQGGLIYFFYLKELRFYSLIIEDDELNKSCINYLKRQNRPVFEYMEDLSEYERELLEKYKNSLESSDQGAVGSKTA
jgi:hypothetical protein